MSVVAKMADLGMTLLVVLLVPVVLLALGTPLALLVRAIIEIAERF